MPVPSPGPHITRDKGSTGKARKRTSAKWSEERETTSSAQIKAYWKSRNAAQVLSMVLSGRHDQKKNMYVYHTYH